MTGSEVIPPESEEGDHSEAPKRVAQTVASRKREYRMEAVLITNNQYRQMMNLQQRPMKTNLKIKIKTKKIVKRKQRVMQLIILFQVQIKELIMCSRERKER